MGTTETRYVLYRGGDDYKMHIWLKLAEGQAPTMLLDPVFSVKNDRGYYDDAGLTLRRCQRTGLIFLSTRQG
ncbi:MAG: hypothetical protein ACLTBV_27720 [Enterocloster bolteae]